MSAAQTRSYPTHDVPVEGAVDRGRAAARALAALTVEERVAHLTRLRHAVLARREEIIDAIQADTAGAVEAISQISTVIGEINDFQATIAAAVEEQTATTNEMSRNVADASTSSSEIATNITGVSQAAVSTTEAMNQSRQAVDELSRMAADLRGVVAQFKA